jgi:hypothetical protein
MSRTADELEADAANLLQRQYERALQVSFCKVGGWLHLLPDVVTVM